METTFNQRALIHSLGQFIDQEVLLRGWVYRLRVLAKTTFIVIKDCSGEARNLRTCAWLDRLDDGHDDPRASFAGGQIQRRHGAR